MKFDEILNYNGNLLNKKYIQSLSEKDRLDLIEPIFNILRTTEFIYPDNELSIVKSWDRIKQYEPNLNSMEIFNNSSLGTDICKYFCHSFYEATEINKPTMIENFKDDIKLKKIIKNRLGLDWLNSTNEVFNLSFKMIVFQGQRSMRFVNATSMFKPIVAKYICMKYSNEGDIVGDYSCGFGGRLLGAVSSNRKYIGTDPLTTIELQKMVDFFGFKNCKLINDGSENYIGNENSIDLYYSSPPYYNQEFYSSNKSQAYNNGEDYFYNLYWKKTLKNIKYMLKPGKWFGLNVKNVPRMLSMAIDEFGAIEEQVVLRTVKSHLTKNKNSDYVKNEYIYMFKNIK